MMISRGVQRCAGLPKRACGLAVALLPPSPMPARRGGSDRATGAARLPARPTGRRVTSRHRDKNKPKRCSSSAVQRNERRRPSCGRTLLAVTSSRLSSSSTVSTAAAGRAAAPFRLRRTRILKLPILSSTSAMSVSSQSTDRKDSTCARAAQRGWCSVGGGAAVGGTGGGSRC